jgi:hypothetical protein
MKAFPFLIQEDTTGDRLEALRENERLHNELWLQEVLRKHPDILPTAEIEPIFHPLIPIGREVTAGTGSIDNLFISHRGYLVLVETKLWRNPEAKREVVAQAIDYGSSISKWTYADLDKVVRDYTRKYADQTYGMIDWVVHQLGPVEGGQQFFEETVAKNLKLGRFLTLIVGDEIRLSVIEMCEYMNKYPHLGTTLALIQLSCYRWLPDSDWPLLIVPNIVVRTKIIERSIVEVTVKKDGSHQIDVRQEGGPGGTPPPPPTEDAFWELLKTQAPESYGIGRELIDSYRKREDCSIEPNPSSLCVWLDIQDSGRETPLFYLKKWGGLLVHLKSTANHLKRAGVNLKTLSAFETEVKYSTNASEQHCAKALHYRDKCPRV